MARTNGNRSLNFSGEFDVSKIIENQKKVISGFSDLKKAASQAVASGGSTSAAQFSAKPLTEYQRELIRIKDETLALSKAKQETAAADRAASLATQAALKEETRIKKEQIALEKSLKAEQSKKKPTQISNSQSEIDAYNNAVNGNKAVTTTLNEKDIAQAKVTSGLINNSKVVKENDTAEKSNNLTKKQSAQLLAEEKLIQQQSTAALKNNAREMLNAKGSIEQRRAALIRLNRTYDQLSAIERASPAGQRLQGIVSRTTQQVKDLEAATGRAQRNVGNYTNAFTKGLSGVFGALRNIAYLLPGLGIAGLIGFIVDPIIKAVSALDIFKAKIDETTKTALSNGEYGAAIKNVNELRINIDLAKKGFIDKSVVVKQYNETLGKTTGEVKNLNEAEASLNKNADAYIQFTLLKAAAQLALGKAAEESVKAAQQAQEDQERLTRQSTAPVIAGDKEGAAVQKILTKTLQRENAERVKDAEKTVKKQLSIAEKFQKDAANIAKKFGFKGLIDTKEADKANDSQLKSQQNLQKRVDALLNEAKRKQLSREGEEIQAVKDKFNAIIKEVERFNNNPKNKAKVGRVTELRNELSGQISAIEFRAETDRTLKFIDEQKKIYADYEQYKIEFGKKSADERFKNELDTSISYLEDLRLRESQLLSKGNISPVEQERLKAVQDRIKAEIDLERKKDDEIYRNALKSTKSFTEQALDIEKQYQIDLISLQSRGDLTAERKAILDRELNDRKKALSKADAEQKIGYTRLLEDLDGLTRGRAIEALQKAKNDYKVQYDAGKLTAKDYYDAVTDIENRVSGLRRSNIFNSIKNSIKDYKEAKKAFEETGAVADENRLLEARAKMYSTIGDRAENASQAISGISQVFSSLGAGSEELQNTLSQITSVLSGAGQLAKGIASGDVSSIISGAVGLITSAVELFNFKDKRIARQIKQYQADLASLGKSYAALEREVSRAAGSDVYSAQQDQVNNLIAQQQKLIAIRDAENQKKKRDQGRIDDLNTQIDDIPNKIQDIQDSISQNLIQGTFRDLSTSLADALVGAFQAGEDGIEAMNTSLDAFIANAIKGGLRIALLEKPIKKFTDDLAQYASANNNSIIGFDFDSYRKQLQDAGKLFNDALKGSEEFFKETDANGKTNSLQGSIKADLTEETGSIIAGAFNGARLSLLNIEGLLRPMVAVNANLANLAQQNLNQITMMQLNTLRTANNTDSLTYRLENLEELTGLVAKNTGDTLSVQLRAAGKS